MPEFDKPTFSYPYQLNAQIQALRNYRDTKEGRAIPAKSSNRLLLASWNIANLGAQERRDKDYRLIAEMISWFDLVAVQEVKDDLTGLWAIASHLPNSWSTIFSDKAGNDERAAFLFDASKVNRMNHCQ